MYDSINFRLNAFVVPNINFLQEVPYCLDNATIGIHNFNDEQVITGSVGGLKVSISQHQVKVKDGSLCKWYLGDNYQTLRRRDTQMAIEKISDTLHLPMDKATVTRIDVAQNIIVEHPIVVYTNHLGVLKNAKRLVEPNGLYYSKNGQIMCFYDKNREQRAKGEIIPEPYKNRNVLRYEQRYTNRIGNQFNVERVTGAMLYDEAFYIGITDRWHNTYKEIQKENDTTLNFQAMKSKQQLYTMGILAMVERVGGETKMIDQINEAQKRGELTPKQAFDLRQAIIKACNTKEGLTIENDAIKELDKKMKEVVRFYR
ncbi:MAG: replication initiation factor domain-containing protein [Prevotella sp.]|nr:replication initiation factor domain-containing protein [Prevotella sp.]